MLQTQKTASSVRQVNSTTRMIISVIIATMKTEIEKSGMRHASTNQIPPGASLSRNIRLQPPSGCLEVPVPEPKHAFVEKRGFLSKGKRPP